MSKQKLQLAGIGAGPFNLSVAALLQKIGSVDVGFFDNKSSFNWHSGLMLEGASLQTSWMKDLVSPIDPTNPYSFMNFLVKQGRFYSFINAEQEAVSRQEFAQYLQWVSEQLPAVHFSSAVREVNYKNQCFWLRFDDKIIAADHLCVGTGTQPFVPAFASSMLGKSVFHGGQMLAAERNFSGKRVVVVGGGQTGAEIFLNLMQARWGACASVSWLSRRDNFEQLDESPFVNDYFTPDYVHHFLGLDSDTKKTMVDKQKLASDGISPSTLKQIYQHLYQTKVVETNPTPYLLMPGRELLGMEKTGNSYGLRVAYDQLGEAEYLQADVVIFCTGFKSVVPACLEPLAEDLKWEADGVLSMQDNYRVRWSGGDHNSIYAVNASRHHHGIVDPQTSLMAWRAATIVNDLLGHQYYQLEQPTMVNWCVAQNKLESEVA